MRVTIRRESNSAVSALVWLSALVLSAPAVSSNAFGQSSPTELLGRSSMQVHCVQDSGEAFIEVAIQLSDRRLFLDGNFVSVLVDELTNRARARCGVQDFRGDLQISVLGAPGAGNLSGGKNLGQPFRITSNSFPNRLSADQQQQQAQMQAQQAAIARGNLRSSFTSQNRVQSWPTDATLVANPFAYKGQVVALPVDFERMMSENEAVFRGHANGQLIVSNVPTTKFRGAESLILAVLDRGLRTIRGATGEISVPDLQYVGSYICRQGGCSDFFN